MIPHVMKDSDKDGGPHGMEQGSILWSPNQCSMVHAWDRSHRTHTTLSINAQDYVLYALVVYIQQVA